MLKRDENVAYTTPGSLDEPRAVSQEQSPLLGNDADDLLAQGLPQLPDGLGVLRPLLVPVALLVPQRLDLGIGQILQVCGKGVEVDRRGLDVECPFQLFLDDVQHDLEFKDCEENLRPGERKAIIIRTQFFKRIIAKFCREIRTKFYRRIKTKLVGKYSSNPVLQCWNILTVWSVNVNNFEVFFIFKKKNKNK